jgi:hypothetical protein
MREMLISAAEVDAWKMVDADGNVVWGIVLAYELAQAGVVADEKTGDAFVALFRDINEHFGGDERAAAIAVRKGLLAFKFKDCCWWFEDGGNWLKPSTTNPSPVTYRKFGKTIN